MNTDTLALSRNDVTKALLEENYLPNHTHDRSEMPPVFKVQNYSGKLAEQFNQLAGQASNKGGVRFDHMNYRLTRFNGLHRNMGIPHPISYGRLVDEIGKHWEVELQPRLALNANTQFPIRMHSDGRVASMRYDKAKNDASKTSTTSRIQYREDADNVDVHALRAMGKRYKVTSDIANFYPSLYSHSIGWAAVGVSAAKKETDRDVWFNRLDSATRDCKRGETVGILTGPGTSTIIAEYVLGSVDIALPYDHLRFVDDYVYYAETREEAEQFLLGLAARIRNVSLELNPSKTSITALPAPVRPKWLREMNQKRPNMAWSDSDIVDYIDDGLDLAQKDPFSSAIKLATNRIVEARFFSHKGYNAGNRLLSIAGDYPNVLPGIAALGAVGCIDATVYGSYLPLLVQKMVSGGYSDGLVWSLYIASLLGIELTDEVYDTVLKSGDGGALALLSRIRPDRNHDLALYYIERTTTFHETDQLWMVGYELYLKGCITSPIAHFSVPADAQGKRNFDVRFQGYEMLKASGVDFMSL